MEGQAMVIMDAKQAERESQLRLERMCRSMAEEIQELRARLSMEEAKNRDLQIRMECAQRQNRENQRSRDRAYRSEIMGGKSRRRRERDHAYGGFTAGVTLTLALTLIAVYVRRWI